MRKLGSISGLGRSPGEEKDYPLLYSGLKNSMDCIANGVAKSQTQLSNFHFHKVAVRDTASIALPNWFFFFFLSMLFLKNLGNL